MLRWSMFLAILLSLIAISLGGVVWFSTMTNQQTEGVRLARVQQQRLQQQLTLLQSPEVEPILANLEESMEALQIRLVEALTQQPLPNGVLSIGYEQALLPQMLVDDVNSERVQVLRLNVKLTMQHSMGLLAVLDRIEKSISTWPHEARACSMQRLPEQRLNAQCVVDFYYWS